MMEDNLPDVAGSDDFADISLDDGATTQPSEGHANEGKQHGSSARKYAGRFESPDELEKSYLGMRKGYDEKVNRAKQLEEILTNPKLQHLAQIDPEVRAAMEKAGFELKGLEPQGSGEQVPASPFEEQVALLKAENDLRWELQEFQSTLGRRMTHEERTDLLRAIEIAPSIPVEEAWKLTPHYEKGIQQKHQQEIDSLRRLRQNAERPMPGPKALPGQKLNLKKPVTEMNGNERSAFLQNLLNRGSQQ